MKQNSFTARLWELGGTNFFCVLYESELFIVVLFVQDAFNYDKGQNLQFQGAIFTGILSFSSGFFLFLEVFCAI